MSSPGNSAADRQWYVWFTVAYSLIFGLIGVGTLLGPGRWYTAPSLVRVHELLPIPWWVYGVFYCYASAGVVWRRPRASAYFVGFVFTGWFAALQLYFTVFGDEIINLPGTGAIVGFPLVSMAGIRYSVRQGQ